MGYPEAYIQYLVEFHATRDYFECHELLEEYWKSIPKGDALSDTWVGLIQIAVARYHERRGNYSGALKTAVQAAKRLEPGALDAIGLDGSQTIRLLHQLIEQLQVSGVIVNSYSDLDLPIKDPGLLEACIQRCKEQGIKWGVGSRMEDEDLIHRHTRRDRSEVAAARAASLRAKRRKPI